MVQIVASTLPRQAKWKRKRSSSPAPQQVRGHRALIHVLLELDPIHENGIHFPRRTFKQGPLLLEHMSYFLVQIPVDDA